MASKQNTKKLIKNIIIGLFTSIVISLILAYKFNIYFYFLTLLSSKTKKEANNKILEELHPIMRYKVSKLISKLEKKGSDITLTSGYRSFEKQDQLFSAGDTTAPAGRSFHNYRMAVDLNIDGLKMASSKSNWMSNGIVQEAKEMGLKWGGDFSGYYDPVHFTLKGKYSIDLLESLYKRGDLVNYKYVKVW